MARFGSLVQIHTTPLHTPLTSSLASSARKSACLLPALPPPPKAIMPTFEDTIRAKLLALKDTLAKRAASPEAILSHRSYEVGDIADTGAQEEQHQTYMHLNALDQQKWRQVQRALELLEQGDYGLCQECDEPIPRGRLLLAPDALRCVDCQTDQEDSSPKSARPGLLDDAF